MGKRVKNFYLDDEVVAHIERTAIHLGISQSRVIELLVQGKLKDQKKKRAEKGETK